MLVALNSVGKITKVSKSTSYEGGNGAGNWSRQIPRKSGMTKSSIENLCFGTGKLQFQCVRL